MKIAHKALASGSILKKPGMDNCRIRICFAILPRRCRTHTGGSVWVMGEQYGVLERLRPYYDWDGNLFFAWSHIAKVTLADLEEFEQVG